MTKDVVEAAVAISYLGAGVAAIWLGGRRGDGNSNFSSLALVWLGYMSLAAALWGGQSRTLKTFHEVGSVGLLLTAAYIVGVLWWLW
jgi:hypothetical protein